MKLRFRPVLGRTVSLLLTVSMLIAMGASQTAYSAQADRSRHAHQGARQNALLQESGRATTRIESLLNEDGTMNMKSGFTGNLDVTGWQMASLPGEAPRFVQVQKDQPEQAQESKQTPLISGDENWDDRFGGLSVDNSVAAVAISGSDVYVGGDFTTAGGIAANHIARWSTVTGQWYALGSGPTNGTDDSVYEIAISGSDVYVGGGFSMAGGVATNYIARWSSASGQWYTLGNGPNNGTNDVVFAIVVSGSNVYAGGWFNVAGGVAANYIARWNTTSGQWSPLASGTDNVVREIAISGTDVYVGGSFGMAGGISALKIARWNSAANQWYALGGGVNDTVQAIAIMGSDVYIGGNFSMAGAVVTNHIARWNNNQWYTVGAGSNNGTNGEIYAIASIDTDLYVGGAFTTAGVVAATKIARWNTVTHQWSTLGSGPTNGTNDSVYDIAGMGTDVYVGGVFSNAGGLAARRIAHWNSSINRWSPLSRGPNGPVYAIAVSGNDMYVGGNFTTPGSSTPMGNIARWNRDTGQWSVLGSGTDGNVYAIGVNGNNVYVGGTFTVAGGAAANYIARWNIITRQWSSLGSGLNSPVHAIAVSGSDVYVGGEFSVAGGVNAARIARWDNSSGQWNSLNSGTNDTVQAIAVSGSDIYVGGIFTTAGGIAANRMARWSTGSSQWYALGSGLNSDVNAIAVSGSDLYVAGIFSTAGGAPANNIARWNGSQWSTLGSGTNGPAYAIASTTGDVYVGGDFSDAGGIAANYIARWNSSTGNWYSLGSGTNSDVRAVTSIGTDVYVGGNFTMTGGKESYRLGIWHEQCPLNTDYLVSSTSGAGIVPAATYVPGSTCNSCTVSIRLPFSYSFYGTPYTSMNASNKGVLQFASNNSSGANTCLPITNMSEAIFAYWDDLNTNINDTMGVYTSVSGTAPNRIFNVRWAAGFEANDATAAFEVRLYEGQPKFDIIYGQTRGGGYSATIGVEQGTGFRSTQYACDAINSVPTGTKLTFDQRRCTMVTSDK